MSLTRPFLILVLSAALSSCGLVPELPKLSDVPACEGAPAGTLYVDASVAASGDGSSLDAAFKTVTEAVSAAPADGHICVVPGTYQEGAQVVLDKNVTVEGAIIQSDADAKAILHGEDTYRVLFVDDTLVEPVVVLENLTITHGLSNDLLEFGGGIMNRGDLTLLNTAVIDNESTSDSGGIDNQGPLALGSGTRISGNVAASSGGAIYNDSGDITILEGAVISNNEATGAGGGVYNSGALRVEDGAKISGNTAALAGGGIYNDSALTLLSGAEISGNTAGGYGGGIYNNLALTFAGGTIITGNTAGASGGGGTGGGVYDNGTMSAPDTSGVTGNLPDDIAP